MIRFYLVCGCTDHRLEKPVPFISTPTDKALTDVTRRLVSQSLAKVTGQMAYIVQVGSVSDRCMSWITQVIKRRRHLALVQALRMLRLHTTRFDGLLTNIFDALKEYDAKFTFPIVGSVALKNPDLIRFILSTGHEVAVHGYRHVRYASFSAEQQETDVRMAVDAFKRLAVPARGFRAPYNGYTEDTPAIIEKLGFLWDIGIGYNPKYRSLTTPFNIGVGDHQSKFTCIPLNEWSDDLMIDTYGYNDRQMSKTLKHVIKEASMKQAMVMFDLHPIRVGQSSYVNALKQAVEYGTMLNGWFPSVSEAVEWWNRKRSWKHDAVFCCLLTGDIDTVTFIDYIKRISQ